ncbi:MAG: phage major capsid protein, partial [Acidobacteriota bacterium]
GIGAGDGYEKIAAALKANNEALTAKLAEQQAEIKSHQQTTEKTAGQITELETQLKQILADAEGAKKKNADLEAELKHERERLDGLEKAGKRPGWDAGEEVKDAGELFAESDYFKEMVAKGRIDNCPEIAVPGGFRSQVKGALRTDIAPDWIRPERLERVLEQRPQLTIRDVLSSRTTTQNAYEYYVRTMNAEAGSPDGSLTYGAAAGVAEGARSPEVEWRWVKKTGRIVRRAHYIPFTLQMMQDDPGVRSDINNDLLFGLDFDVEQQAVYGDGLDENLTGMVPFAGQAYAWADGVRPDPANNIVGDNRLDALRRAMTKATVLHYRPDFLVINPKDWEDIELLKGTDGHYLWLNISTGNQPRFFAVTAVVTTAILEGDALLGSSIAVQMLDRQQDALRTTDSHNDDFLKGTYVVEASTRVGLAIKQPNALVSVDLTTPPAPVV